MISNTELKELNTARREQGLSRLSFRELNAINQRDAAQRRAFRGKRLGWFGKTFIALASIGYGLGLLLLVILVAVILVILL